MAFYGLPPVHVRGALVWSAAAVGTIYVGSAAFDVRRDAIVAKQLKAQQQRFFPGRFGSGSGNGGKNVTIDMADVDQVRALRQSGELEDFLRPGRDRRRRSDSDSENDMAMMTSLSSLSSHWANLTEPAQLMAALVTANVGVYAVERLGPSWIAESMVFSHVPARLGTNYTLLTAAFGHVGLAHLGLNMYGIVQFLPPVAHYSAQFAGTGAPHLAAFYLSAGILSSLAFHLASVWPRPADRLVGARGASGAVMAVVGAYGASFPDSRLGIILIPFSLPAQDFLWLLAGFETYGLLRGFRRLNFAHAAHLAGLATGAAYVYWDGRRHIWEPTRRWVFRRMQQVNMV